MFATITLTTIKAAPAGQVIALYRAFAQRWCVRIPTLLTYVTWLLFDRFGFGNTQAHQQAESQG
jgi:hypothetical protein